MMQWISEGRRGGMDAVVLNRIGVLREEMNSARGKKKEKKKARKASSV